MSETHAASDRGLDPSEWARQFYVEFASGPWVLSKVANWFRDAIQAGYDAARPLDPGKIDMKVGAGATEKAPWVAPVAIGGEPHDLYLGRVVQSFVEWVNQ